MMDGQTELYGVIGNPVQHRLSPILHNGAFKRLGLNAVYLVFEVKYLEEALKGIRGLGLKGVSVTIPFKTAVIPFLDKVEGLAKKIGAVNTIVNRSRDRGKTLSRELKCHFLPMSSLVKMKAGELEADVMINATSLGMVPRDGETPLPKKLLKKGMMVMDIVYEPLQTKLLREAKEKGCLTINGLEMLVRQGVAQFEIWTGRRPDLKQIRNDLYKALK